MSHQTNLDKCIDELALSVRLSNILENAARVLPSWAKDLPPPKTLGDLTRWSKLELLKLPHMGKRTFEELEKVLASEGVSLRGQETTGELPADATLRATTEIVQSLSALPVHDQARAIIAAATILGHEELVRQ